MRIALQFGFPGLIEQLHGLDANIQAFVPDTAASPSASFDAEVLLCAVAATDDLPALIQRCRGLRWIHILSTGVDGFPLQLMADKLVTCSRGASAVPIAEWVMAMMLAHEKQLPQSWITEPPAAWYSANLGTLAHKTLGIVGFGSIGQAVARRALAFDMNVIAKVRSYRASPLPGVELVADLDSLLSASDHVVLAVPSTPVSDGMFDFDTLSLLKPGCHLINVSRASLIDQEALRRKLDEGQIARASLDVVEPEPLPAGHWIYRHPQIRLSPHIAWSGPQMIERLRAAFFDNVKAYMSGQPLRGEVDTEQGY